MVTRLVIGYLDKDRRNAVSVVQISIKMRCTILQSAAILTKKIVGAIAIPKHLGESSTLSSFSNVLDNPFVSRDAIVIVGETGNKC